MRWQVSNRADPVAAAIADRHYNRQKIGSDQFVPPGRCLVLLKTCQKALWVTSWPYMEYVRHEWAGAWVCSLFRNESIDLASELITEAVAATRWYWSETPAHGMVTFINPSKVKPTKVRGKNTWGRTYEKAGFRYAGLTKGGLIAMQLLPCDMPEARTPLLAQQRLFDLVA